MHIERYLAPRYLGEKAVVMIILLMLLGAAAVYVAAQGQLNLSQIRALPGQEIGRGTNQTAVTDLNLYTYRVEALNLSQAVKVKIDGKRAEMNEAWRITLSGKHFEVGAMPAVLLIDNQPVAIGMENPDQTEVSFIVFNSRFIRTGATLAITYEGDLLIDSRDPDQVTAEFKLPGLEGAQKYLLPETMTIRNK